MILGVFIEYFRVKIGIELLKNRCDLIIIVEFDFGLNLIIGSKQESIWPIRSLVKKSKSSPSIF